MVSKKVENSDLASKISNQDGFVAIDFRLVLKSCFTFNLKLKNSCQNMIQYTSLNSLKKSLRTYVLLETDAVVSLVADFSNRRALNIARG